MIKYNIAVYQKILDVPKRGEHHEKDLAKGTARLYYNTFVTALNEAVREGIIPENPTKLLKKEEKKLIGQGESRRCYLSIEEIRLLMATPCKDETVIGRRSGAFLGKRTCQLCCFAVFGCNVFIG